MELASRRILSVLLLIVVGLSAQQSGQAQDWARLAAYQAIKWPEGQTQPRILLDGVWYDLLAIEGISTTQLIEHAKSTYVQLWQKRFEEDMVEILSALGRPHTGTVQLGLRDLVTMEILTRSSALNAANRNELTRARAAGAQPALAQINVVPSRASFLSGEQIAQDLAALQREMETRWAYLKTNGVDYRAAIDGLRARGANGMARDAYGIEVQTIISLFIDGHAGFSGFSYPAGRLPFFIESTNGRFVAVRPNRSGFQDPEYPYIARIDGRPIEEWLQAAAPFVSKASPQWMRRNALSHIGNVQFMRGVMGIERTDSVSIQLASASGDRTRQVVLPVTSQSSSAGAWPRTTSHLLDGNFGSAELVPRVPLFG